MGLFRARGPLAELERRLGYRFRRRALLEQALTHSSWANEQGLDAHYERLEFLGDAVLGLLVSEWLFGEHPEVSEGELSGHSSRLVSERSLAGWARRLDLGAHLRLGLGEERSGGRDKRSLLADAMEAVLGAAFVDGGLRAARAIASPLLAAHGGDLGASDPRDPKTRLQEWAQARGCGLPVYTSIDEHGPDHDKTFVVECELGGRGSARGEGRTKKSAERRAARALLAALEGDG